MNHTTQCRFCQKPITLEIDSDYASLGDPFNILKLASCDRCSDLRVNRKRLEDKIQRACSYLEFLGEADAKQTAILRNILISLSRSYGKLIRNWHQADGDFYRSDIADRLATDPANWAEHLNEYWRVFPEWRRSQSQAGLPYKDA